MAEPLNLRVERPEDGVLADGLIACAFGPGRYAKTAERLREGSSYIPDLSFIAWRGETAVGCVRLWPIAIGEAEAVLLGPFAVEASQRSTGVGAALIRRACEAARADSRRLVLLVGDLTYFGPLGFSPAPGVRLPGPVDPGRVLIRALAPGAADGLSGGVRARVEPPRLALAAE